MRRDYRLTSVAFLVYIENNTKVNGQTNQFAGLFLFAENKTTLYIFILKSQNENEKGLSYLG